MATNEKRKHQRHIPPPVSLVSKNGSFGQVINVSLGGFSFKYLDMETPVQHEDRINLTLGDFTMENIHITITWESRAPISGRENITVNQAGARFDLLTAEQRSILQILTG